MCPAHSTNLINQQCDGRQTKGQKLASERQHCASSIFPSHHSQVSNQNTTAATPESITSAASITCWNGITGKTQPPRMGQRERSPKPLHSDVRKLTSLKQYRLANRDAESYPPPLVAPSSLHADLTRSVHRLLDLRNEVGVLGDEGRQLRLTLHSIKDVQQRPRTVHGINRGRQRTHAREQAGKYRQHA